jgi:hypothetical protein
MIPNTAAATVSVAPAPPAAPTLEQVLAFAVVTNAIRKVTKGRKTRLSALTGTERRAVRRVLERRERRLTGQPVGFVRPSLSARATGRTA